MAITTNFRVEVLPWRGFDNPALPSGAYVGHAFVVGDGTGGANTVTFLFQFSGDPLSSRLYNLEQFWARGSATVQSEDSGQIIVQNMGHLTPDRPIPDSRLMNFQYRFGANTIALQTDGMLPRPLFLGAPSAANLACGIAFARTNVDGEANGVTIYGYIWQPRSLLAEGGLQRPVGGLWGA